MTAEGLRDSDRKNGWTNNPNQRLDILKIKFFFYAIFILNWTHWMTRLVWSTAEARPE